MKKWEVFKDGKSLGLKTAKEIRQALRDGAIDPFDMVCAEGSTIKSELVEVDEIFNEEDESELADNASNNQAPPDLPSKIIDLDQATGTGHRPAPAAPKREFPSPAPLDQNSKMSATAMNRAIKAEGQVAIQSSSGGSEKKKAKKFQLIDEKKRVLGPVSAVEIQSLFQRGIISTSVKVKKVDGSKLIPVRQFIANYSEKRIKALANQGSANKSGNPSSKVLNELYQNMNSKKMAQKKPPFALILGVVVVLVAIVAFVVIPKSSDDSDPARLKMPKKTEQNEKRDPPPVPARRELQKVEEKAPPPPAPVRRPSPVQRAPEPEPAPPKPLPVERKPVEPVKSRPKPPAPRPAPKAKIRPPARKPAPKVQTPPTQKAPRLPSASRPAPSSGPGPIERALSNVGGVATIGPVKFRERDLENCALKCRLRFRDSTGASLEGVFFKGAYYDVLKSSPGGVTITGSTKVEGGALVIFIQDVRK